MKTKTPKAITSEEINLLLTQVFNLGYETARAFFEPRLYKKKELELKEKALKQFLEEKK